jgi:hypothetical protein
VHMHRQFIIAPSLARLIEREKGGERVRQGYFPDRPDRGTHVQVEGETGHLILVEPVSKRGRAASWSNLISCKRD